MDKTEELVPVWESLDLELFPNREKSSKMTTRYMKKAISVADANHKFSQVLRQVREGRSYLATSHGRPVARISPIAEDREAARAREVLLKRLRSQPVMDVGRWQREDLYK